MKVIDLIKDNKIARFKYFRDNELWYETEDKFLFPIPVDDTIGGTFNTEEKASLLKRWIRKYLERLEKTNDKSNS